MKPQLDEPQFIRRSVLAVVLLDLLALALIAALAGPPAAGADDVRVRLVGLALYAAPGAHGAPRSGFSASQDNEIYTEMTWAGISGPHDAYLTFRSPDGAVYQVLDVPFLVPKGAPVAADFVQQRPGVLHPVRVQAATPAGDKVVIWGALPIAGTWMSRLLGAWTLQVGLDTDQAVDATVNWKLTP